MSRLLGVLYALEIKKDSGPSEDSCVAELLEFTFISEVRAMKTSLWVVADFQSFQDQKGGKGLCSRNCFVRIISIKPKEHRLFGRDYKTKALADFP